jgi:transposase
LQALRGVALTTAATVVSELGSLTRFENPRQLMGYRGLVSREHSSGNRTQRGAITKTGNAHLRRVLVEAVWAYQYRPAVNGRLLRRQRALTLSEEARRISWKAQQRLHKRYLTLMARGKHKGQIATALAREMLGFVWAIAVHTEAQFKSAKAA